MSPSIAALRLATGLVLLALLAGITWAAQQSGIRAGMEHLLSDRWGIVTLLDLYAGGFVIACWIRICVRSWWTWLLWVLGLVCLGHLVSLTFLLWRAVRARTWIEVFAPAPHDAGNATPTSDGTTAGR
jgi:hypothetical protein